MPHKPNTWRYEPTPQKIAEECRRIQAGWSRNDRVQRLVRKPVVEPWTPPVLLDIVDERGEFVLITRESYCA